MTHIATRIGLKKQVTNVARTPLKEPTPVDRVPHAASCLSPYIEVVNRIVRCPKSHRDRNLDFIEICDVEDKGP
jgi:hypothetical protein